MMPTVFELAQRFAALKGVRDSIRFTACGVTIVVNGRTISGLPVQAALETAIAIIETNATAKDEVAA